MILNIILTFKKLFFFAFNYRVATGGGEIIVNKRFGFPDLLAVHAFVLEQPFFMKHSVKFR